MTLEAASSILAAIGGDPVVRDQVRAVLAARRDASTGATMDELEAALDRFFSHLGGVVPDALQYAVQDDTERMANIRRLYLEQTETYTLAELAALWDIPLDEVCAIYRDACGAAERDRFRISRADAIGASTVFQIFRPVDVERALGADFARMRPEAWRTIPVLAYLPRFIANSVLSSAGIPSTRSLAARVERLVAELCEADHLLSALSAENDDEP